MIILCFFFFLGRRKWIIDTYFADRTIKTQDNLVPAIKIFKSKRHFLQFTHSAHHHLSAHIHTPFQINTIQNPQISPPARLYYHHHHHFFAFFKMEGPNSTPAFL